MKNSKNENEELKSGLKPVIIHSNVLASENTALVQSEKSNIGMPCRELKSRLRIL